MSLTRKIIITVLLGFLVGAIAGGVSAYIHRLNEGSVVPPEEKTLSLVCIGGSTPRIRVIWPEKLSPLMGGLERSVDAGTWAPVFSGDRKPTKDGFTDDDVTLGKQYGYRIALRPGDKPTEVFLTTDAITCANQ